MKSDRPSPPQSDNCVKQSKSARSAERPLANDSASPLLSVAQSGFGTCLGMLIRLSKTPRPEAREAQAAQPEPASPAAE